MCSEQKSSHESAGPSAKDYPSLAETSLALAAVCLAIATLLPVVGLELQDQFLKKLVICISLMSGVVAVLSQYGALWLLGRYCFPGEASRLGFREIAFLIASPARVGPLWPMSMGLALALVASILISILTALRVRA